MDTRTIVATFRDYSSAQQAARELENLGVSRDAIHIDSNRKTTGAGSAEHPFHTESHSGFTGWWESLFGKNADTQDRRDYEGALANGSAILRATVADRQINDAVDLLNRNGAVDIERETKGTPAERTGRAGDNGPIEVVEEELQVGKRAVRRGGVRIYSHVVNEPVEQKVQLREEHVKVERRPVNRDAKPEELSGLQDQTIEVEEFTEEPVVNKRARIKEEVVVGKEATERTETVRDNVRHTEVEVQDLNDPNRREAGARTRPATGMSPNAPAPSVLSGSSTTAGQGTLAGEATTGLRDRDFTPEYRKNFEQAYGSDQGFDAMRPAYEYGERSASDARFRGRTWDQAERDLRADYERNHPATEWDRAKDAIRYGWNRHSGTR